LSTDLDTTSWPHAPEATLSVGKASRLTGLSVEVLRAWERRHGAVTPARTPGGTRRYGAADVTRLQLLRQLVESGDRIGDVAALDDDALRARLATRCIARDSDTSAVVSAVRDLDGHTVKRLLEAHLAELGPAAFATDFAMPLARTVGDAWRRGELSIAAEHLLTSVLRSILAGAMEGDGSTEARLGPRIVFATPSGEPHDLGLMAAAVVAAHAGAVPIVLGADLPVDEVVETARRTGAEAVAVGVVTLERDRAEAWLGALRAALPSGVQLWVGGAGARLLLPRRGATVVGDLSGLARAVAEIH